MFEDAGQKKIEVPPTAKASAGAPQVFSMPEKFRGLAARVNPPTMKPAAAASPAALPPPLVPAPRPLSPTPLPKGEGTGVRGKKKGMSKTTRALLIAGVVLLVVLVGSGVYLYFVFKPVTTTPLVNTTTNNSVNVNKPTNQPATNTNTNQATNQPSTNSASPFPNNSQPGRDTDSDGLTDAEEILYKTSSKKPDTDSDGFLDGNEVFNGYDPNSPDPAHLRDSSVVTLYQKMGVFEILYPQAWTVREGTDGSTTFVVPSGETITIGLESKEVGVSLADWFSGTNLSSEVKVTSGETKQGYSTLEAEDQMTVYIESGTRVIVVSYQNTVKASVDYLTTFEMMMNNLTLAP
ncbi:MAG: hypothetical protein WC702_01915 [Patescibacteria group bacterium]